MADISSIRCIPIGGSAAPRSLIEHFDKKYGAYDAPRLGHDGDDARSAPSCRPQELHASSWPEDERYAIRAKQGAPRRAWTCGSWTTAGAVQPWDGKSHGRDPGARAVGDQRLLRQPGRRDQFTDDGWFRTGDVATIDPEGYIQITDRTKDLIKSGGEWISQRGHGDHDHGPSQGAGGRGDRGAAPQAGWSGPLACVVPEARVQGPLSRRRSSTTSAPAGQVGAARRGASFIDAVPKTSVGKFDKKVLCESASRTGRRRRERGIQTPT